MSGTSTALLLAGVLTLGVSAASVSTAWAEEEMPPLPKVKWSFDGAFGTYDRASLQRGFQVYNEVCSACHAMHLVSYRNLAAIGLSPEQIKAIAASKTVEGPLDDSGDPTTRPGLPSDHFASPFKNDKAARAANNGALPPDQSDLEKAREGGPNYIYALMTGYVPPPSGFAMPDGMYYNSYFLGHKIHMPAPLTDDRVTYADGTKATLDQEARDVATFLTWASNPEMEQRKHMGIRMVAFFALMTGVTYAAKRKLWAKIH